MLSLSFPPKALWFGRTIVGVVYYNIAIQYWPNTLFCCCQCHHHDGEPAVYAIYRGKRTEEGRQFPAITIVQKS